LTPKHGRLSGNRNLPKILIVDDRIEDADAKRLIFDGVATARPLTPGDVEETDLKWADVVLVDFKLTEWKTDTRLSIGERPADGVALAAVFRSHSPWKLPVAFALHSGQLDQLSGGLTAARHLNSIARVNNLEWVFSKNDAETSLPMRDQVISLARAVRRLPKDWPTERPAQIRSAVDKLLDLKGSKWKVQAWQHIDESHPPIHELSPPTYGITFVRWLLTSILPYPTFLWDYRYLAARLRVSPSSLCAALKSDRALLTKLAPFRYTGILSDFLGDRWWRPGIESFLWEETSARSFDGDALKKIIRRLSRRLDPVVLVEPVVAFDEKLRAIDNLVELSEAVELQPEDWPSYAGRPWMLRSLAASTPRLRSLVAASSQL
jgi:hypothetical protein